MSDSQRIWAPAPRRPARISDAAAKQKGQQALFAFFLVTLGILPGSGQISDGLVLGQGNVNSGQFTGAMQTGKHQGIPAVIFDLFATWFRDPGWCHHRAIEPLSGEVTIDLVSTGAGLIHKLQPVTVADQFSNHLVERRKGAVYFAVVPHLPFAAGLRDGDIDGIFMDVHTNKRAMICHDLPPWFWLCVGLLSMTPNITHVCKDGRSFVINGLPRSAKFIVGENGPSTARRRLR
jgi:hypothetical protein